MPQRVYPSQREGGSSNEESVVKKPHIIETLEKMYIPVKNRADEYRNFVLLYRKDFIRFLKPPKDNSEYSPEYDERIFDLIPKVLYAERYQNKAGTLCFIVGKNEMSFIHITKTETGNYFLIDRNYLKLEGEVKEIFVDPDIKKGIFFVWTDKYLYGVLRHSTSYSIRIIDVNAADAANIKEIYFSNGKYYALDNKGNTRELKFSEAEWNKDNNTRLSELRPKRAQ